MFKFGRCDRWGAGGGRPSPCAKPRVRGREPDHTMPSPGFGETRPYPCQSPGLGGMARSVEVQNDQVGSERKSKESTRRVAAAISSNPA